MTLMPIEANRARASKKKAAYGAQFGPFLAIIKYTFMLSILPIILYFIYSVVTDPDLPRLLRYLWSMGKKRWLSYLGRK